MWNEHLHRTDKPVNEELFPIASPPADQAMIDEFISAVREQRDPECSAADNLRSLAMVFAAIASAKEQKRVRLDDFLARPGREEIP